MDYTIIRELAGPIATVIAAVTAAGVAMWFGRVQAASSRRQVEIANDRLALDLFQKRIEIFSTLKIAIAEVTTLGASSFKAEHSLLEAIDGARFLFDHDVRRYMDDLWQHLLSLDLCNKELKNPQLPSDERLLNSKGRQDHWLAITGFYKQIDNIFGPYLTARHKFTQ